MKIILGLLMLFGCSLVNAYNLPQQPIKSYNCSVCGILSHENLQDRWPTDAFSMEHVGSNRQKSYSYTKRVTTEQLEQGITLPIHAPGAVLHITPLQNKTIPPLVLKSAFGSFMNLKEASVLYSQDEPLAESLKTDLHQTLLQIKPELDDGNFVLKSKKVQSHNANAYLVNVFEKYSLIYLQIEPSALQYQYGDEFTATITLKDNMTTYPIDTITASLVSPNNQTIPLKIKELKHNQFEASAIIRSEENTRGDNWYIEVEVVSDDNESNPTYRTGRAAFSYSIPSASLVSIKKISSKPLTFATTLDVATASRYVLQGVLFRKNYLGEPMPIETAQSAQWLEQGRQTIKFSFDNSKQLAEDQLFVGYLHLTDYGQLKPVYQYDLPIKLSQLWN